MSGNVKVVFARAFKWSPDGHTVLEFGLGEAEVPLRCAEVAVAAGCAELVDAGEASETQETEEKAAAEAQPAKPAKARSKK